MSHCAANVATFPLLGPTLRLCGSGASRLGLALAFGQTIRVVAVAVVAGDDWLSGWRDGRTDGRTNGRTDDCRSLGRRLVACSVVHLVRLLRRRRSLGS